jgi:hypothetical protein
VQVKGQKLPREVVQVLWKIGLGGKRIYVPKQPSQTLVATHTPILLEEIERFYEEQGLTFYEEGSRRKVFSGLFGKNRVSMKYGLKSRTAASVASAAWRGWRDWFGHKERSRLILLQSIAESNEKEYGALYFSYLQIRNRLRKKQKVTEDYYAKYHSISVETVEEMIRFA